ncbi:MAG: hypothetical protein QXV22_04340, partial [Thermoplasmataceae archaeon]
TRFTDVMNHLIVRPEVMKENLLKDDYVMSERIVTELSRRGFGRQESHEFVRKAAMDGYAAGISLRESMIRNGILKKIGEEDLEDIMNPREFIGQAPRICDKVIEESKRVKLSIYGDDFGGL